MSGRAKAEISENKNDSKHRGVLAQTRSPEHDVSSALSGLEFFRAGVCGPGFRAGLLAGRVRAQIITTALMIIQEQARVEQNDV